MIAILRFMPLSYIASQIFIAKTTVKTKKRGRITIFRWRASAFALVFPWVEPSNSLTTSEVIKTITPNAAIAIADCITVTTVVVVTVVIIGICNRCPDY